MMDRPDILVKCSRRLEGLGVQPDTGELNDLLRPERRPPITIARGLEVNHVDGAIFLFGGQPLFAPASIGHHFVTVEPERHLTTGSRTFKAVHFAVTIAQSLLYHFLSTVYGEPDKVYVNVDGRFFVVLVGGGQVVPELGHNFTVHFPTVFGLSHNVVPGGSLVKRED